MEPLRLDLSESTSLRLLNAPQEVKDNVESQHSKLIAEVRKFYAEMQKQLENYAIDQIKKAEAQEPHSPAPPTRKIKSIVKRRPSTADKRVSFSSSPPKVELFKDDECDSDEEAKDPAGSKNAPNEGSDAHTALPRSNLRIALPSLGLRGGLPSSNIPSSTNMNSTMTSTSTSTPTQKPSASMASMASSTASSTGPNYDDLFNFEDVIESSSFSSDPDVSVDSHHSLSSPVLEPENPGKNDEFSDHDASSSRHQDDQILAGSSAAMDITPHFKGLDSDGGPIPKTEKGRRDEAEEELDISMSLNNLSLNKLSASAASMDPSHMSFSQRMEWENLWKLQGQHRKLV